MGREISHIQLEVLRGVELALKADYEIREDSEFCSKCGTALGDEWENEERGFHFTKNELECFLNKANESCECTIHEAHVHSLLEFYDKMTNNSNANE